MPGIAGILSPRQGLASPTAALATFQAVYAVQGVTFTDRAWCDHDGVILNALTGLLPDNLAQPATDARGNTLLFLDGEIFNQADLRQQVDLPGESSVCDLLLALYQSYGGALGVRLNGEFAIVIYEKAEKRLTIFSDHLASKPIYFAQEGDALLFGSEKKAILAVKQGSTTVDPVGLLQVFTLEHNLGTRTFIAGLHTLPPYTRLTYDDGGLSLQRYAPLTFQAPQSTLRAEEWAALWAEQLQRATSQRLQGKQRVLISLSGGLDSRAVAAAIQRDFRPVAARTRGDAASLEVAYATEIARRLGFQHFREDPVNVPLSQILPPIVWRTEGAMSFIHCMSMANHALCKAHGDFMAGGWIGGIASGSAISPFTLLPQRREHFLNLLYRRYPLYNQPALAELFNPEFLQRHLPALRATFLDSFAPYSEAQNYQSYELWNLYERQSQLTLATGLVDSYLFGHIRPLADKAVLQLTMPLPLPLRFGQTLYQVMIHQIGPELRTIPNANTDLTLKGSVLGNLGTKGVALWHKGQQKMMKKVGLTREKTGSLPLPDDLAANTRRDPGLRHFLETFVQAPTFDDTIFNRQGILGALEKHYQGTVDYAERLCMLATFAMGYAYFVDKRPVACPAEAEPLADHALV